MAEEIVDIVLNKKFYIKQLHTDQVQQFKAHDEEYVDKKKELKGVLTDFIVNNFIDLPSQMGLFIKLVVGTFNTAIDKYTALKNLPEKSITFVYKGGNILRFIANETESMFPGDVANNLRDFYKDTFKKSDADFSIYINPYLPNYDQIYEDIKNITFLLLNRIREIFLKDPAKYFQFYRYNDQEKQKLLIEQINKLNKTNIVKNMEKGFCGSFDGIMFANQIVDLRAQKGDPKDFLKIKQDYEIVNGENIMYKINLKSLNGKPNQEIFASGNPLYFVRGENISSFYLARCKFYFNTHFSCFKKYENGQEDGICVKGDNEYIPLDGELIDVTIINRDSTEIYHMINCMDKFIRKYEVEVDGEKIPFHGYSLDYLVYDLEYILFSYNEFPWEDLKYAKRIGRLLYLYFIMLLRSKNFNENNNFNKNSGMNYIETINTIMISIQKWVNTQNIYPIESLKLISQFIKTIKNDKDRCHLVRDNPFGNLIKKLGDILASEDNEKIKKETDDFVSIIMKNLKVMAEAINGIEEFKRAEGSVNENEIYDTEFK
jgi:hypothetical protein